MTTGRDMVPWMVDGAVVSVSAGERLLYLEQPRRCSGRSI